MEWPGAGGQHETDQKILALLSCPGHDRSFHGFSRRRPKKQAAAGGDKLVNINSQLDAGLLAKLPQAVRKWRSASWTSGKATGNFKRTQDLMKVKGIGEKIFAKAAAVDPPFNKKRREAHGLPAPTRRKKMEEKIKDLNLPADAADRLGRDSRQEPGEKIFRAWKGYLFETLNKLADEKLIIQFQNTKSVTLTEAGKQRPNS